MPVMSSSNPFSRAAFTFSPAVFFLPILGQWFLTTASKRFQDFQGKRGGVAVDQM